MKWLSVKNRMNKHYTNSLLEENFTTEILQDSVVRTTEDTEPKEIIHITLEEMPVMDLPMDMNLTPTMEHRKEDMNLEILCKELWWSRSVLDVAFLDHQDLVDLPELLVNLVLLDLQVNQESPELPLTRLVLL